LKIIHLSTSDLNGGAAIAAYRVYKAQLKNSNLDPHFLVQQKKSNDDSVTAFVPSSFKRFISTLNIWADELTIRMFSEKSKGRFTFPSFGENLAKNKLIKECDVINLHWISGAFLSLNSLEQLKQLNKPIVWTQHDMWAFTGGCHYTAGCEKFITSCSICPKLIFKSENDFSAKIFKRKKVIFDQMNLTLVSSSNWLAEESMRSELLRTKNSHVIPTPIDFNIYTNINKEKARTDLRLPLGKKLILAGAMNLEDERKGFHFLIEALQNIYNSNNKLCSELELVVFGKLDETVFNKIPFKVHQLGRLNNEDDIVKAYNTADIYLAPSLEDNLPNTIMEAMSCGIPVVAFNVGGIPDMIDHNTNGILATLLSSEELANGIKLLLNDDSLRKNFSNSAREKVIKNFDQIIIAEKYFEVYKSLL
jgi:glycosyltransferase involved in cell wall biosynthesis